VTPGDLVQAALLFSILAFPMRVFGFFLQEMPRAVVSIDRIDAVTASPDAPAAIGGPALPLPDGDVGLALRDVSFAYDGDPVLSDVTFEVQPGEIVAIVGPTGSGKSTLTNLLVRLVEPTAGEIEVSGVPAQRVDPDELRAAVSVVFQESFLFATTLRENVSLDDLPEEQVDDAAEIARVTRFVEHLPHGWTTTVGERGVTLSGGQRQRVALARALVSEASILVLDEPTAHVDPETAELLVADVLSAADERSVLLITHRPEGLELVDEVVRLAPARAS